MILTSGRFDLGRTTMFTDTVCGGQPSDSIRTADPARLKLNETRQSTLTLGQNGTVSALTYMVLDLPLELRNGDDGCSKPYVSTGYSTANETIRLTGVGRRAGPRAGPLKMSAVDIDLFGCLAPGSTTQPCNGFEVPLPATVSMSLQVAVIAGRLTARGQFASPPSTAYGCVARHASAAVPSTMMFSAPRSSALQPGGEFVRVVLGGDRDEDVLPAAQRREALGLQAVRDVERLLVGLQVDAHLPLRAALGGLARLALLARRVLGRLLLRGERQRLVRVLPGLLDRVPLGDRHDAVQVVRRQHLGDRGGGRLGLRAVGRVDEHVRPVGRDGQPPAELILDLVRDLALVHPLQKMARADLVLELGMDPPVVTHVPKRIPLGPGYTAYSLRP